MDYSHQLIGMGASCMVDMHHLLGGKLLEVHIA